MQHVVALPYLVQRVASTDRPITASPKAAEISSLILYPFDQSVAINLSIYGFSARELFRILLYLAQESRTCIFYSELSENLKDITCGAQLYLR